jgi:hypothetical protein
MFWPVMMKTHRAGDLREQRVVTTHAYIDAGMNWRAALPDDDVAGPNLLAAKALDAEAFGF